MKRIYGLSMAVLSIAALATVVPAQAQGLLGGNKPLVTLNDGPARHNGTINLGIGGGNNNNNRGNVVDLNVGGHGNHRPIANANVSTHDGNQNEDARVDLNLLGNDGVDGEITLGGDNTAGVDVEIGGGDGVLIGPDDGPTNGNNSPQNGVANGNMLANAQQGNGGAACAGQSPEYLIGLFNSTQINPASWARASNVDIVPVQVCPEVEVAVNGAIDGSAKGVQLQQAISADALIAASISRTNYAPGDVFAVEGSGRQLMVYVY